MNKLKLMIAMMILGLASAASAETATKCYIYLALPCHNNLAFGPMKGWFIDGDPMAQHNAARCAQRAADWYNYCGDPLTRQNAYSAFNVILKTGNEVSVQYTVKNAGGSALYGPGSAGSIGVISLGQ